MAADALLNTNGLNESDISDDTPLRDPKDLNAFSDADAKITADNDTGIEVTELTHLTLRGANEFIEFKKQGWGDVSFEAFDLPHNAFLHIAEQIEDFAKENRLSPDYAKALSNYVVGFARDFSRKANANPIYVAIQVGDSPIEAKFENGSRDYTILKDGKRYSAAMTSVKVSVGISGTKTSTETGSAHRWAEDIKDNGVHIAVEVPSKTDLAGPLSAHEANMADIAADLGAGMDAASLKELMEALENADLSSPEIQALLENLSELKALLEGTLSAESFDQIKALALKIAEQLQIGLQDGTIPLSIVEATLETMQNLAKANNILELIPGDVLETLMASIEVSKIVEQLNELAEELEAIDPDKAAELKEMIEGLDGLDATQLAEALQAIAGELSGLSNLPPKLSNKISALSSRIEAVTPIIAVLPNFKSINFSAQRELTGPLALLSRVAKELTISEDAPSEISELINTQREISVLMHSQSGRSIAPKILQASAQIGQILKSGLKTASIPLSVIEASVESLSNLSRETGKPPVLDSATQREITTQIETAKLIQDLNKTAFEIKSTHPEAAQAITSLTQSTEAITPVALTDSLTQISQILPETPAGEVLSQQIASLTPEIAGLSSPLPAPQISVAGGTPIAQENLIVSTVAASVVPNHPLTTAQNNITSLATSLGTAVKDITPKALKNAIETLKDSNVGYSVTRIIESLKNPSVLKALPKTLDKGFKAFTKPLQTFKQKIVQRHETGCGPNCKCKKAFDKAAEKLKNGKKLNFVEKRKAVKHIKDSVGKDNYKKLLKKFDGSHEDVIKHLKEREEAIEKADRVIRERTKFDRVDTSSEDTLRKMREEAEALRKGQDECENDGPDHIHDEFCGHSVGGSKEGAPATGSIEEIKGNTKSGVRASAASAPPPPPP